MDTDLRECQICHAVFNSNLGLSNHMRIHNAQQQQQKQEKTTPPKTTQKTIQSKISKNIHFGVTASDLLRRIRCRLCQKRFSTKKGYRKHMLIDHQVKNVEFVKCTICNADFTHEKGLKLHMMRVHDAIATNLSTGTMDSQFECNQCQIIFKGEEQLNAHKSQVHNKNDVESDQLEISLSNDASATLSQSGTESNIWFQCRYCPANFDTNKKLAIHTNSHDEFDSNDYSCKDCGNVYSGRKSLWVHRYKKHPLIPEPSLCTLCNKTFFDKNMLEIHMTNYSHSTMPNTVENDQNDEVCHMNETYDEDEMEGGDEDEVGEFQENIESSVETGQVPEVRCSMCNLKFTDVELFSKHLNMHEMELYTDNPLAAMFDTGPEDPNKFYESRLGENGEYMCDICPKTFPMLTAFKVHRNWHFRSDGKQVPADPNTTWRGVPRKKKDPATSVKCQYCNSLFISENNLRRHIMELHRRELSNGEAPKIFIEKYLECKKCEMKFRFKAEWITHKLEHVQNATVDSTFGWGCEICGKIVSRKERLIQHVKAHIKEDSSQKNDANSSNDHKSNYNQENSEGGFESNSQDSNSLCESNDKTSDNNEKEDSSNKSEREIVAHVTSDGTIMRKCEIENEEDPDDEDEDNDSEVNNSSTYNSSDEEEHRTDSEESSAEFDNDDESTRQRHLYSCDLCHVNFETSKELQCHVTSHFLNGPGSVTLTETEKNE